MKPPRPVVSVTKEATVLDAVRTMVQSKVGAVTILEDGRLLGVFSERDVTTRVVLKQLDPSKTPVTEVMTTKVVTVRENTERSTVLRLMAEHHIRHLPVVDAEGKVVTMLSMRHLLRAEVQDLQQTVWELIAENAIGGAGGD
jgi:CBS domain-containing protein